MDKDSWEQLYTPDRVGAYIVAVETGYAVNFKFWLTLRMVETHTEWEVYATVSGQLVDQLPDWARSRPWQVYVDEPNAWPQAIYWSVKGWEMWLRKYRDLGIDRPSL